MAVRSFFRWTLNIRRPHSSFTVVANDAKSFCSKSGHEGGTSDDSSSSSSDEGSPFSEEREEAALENKILTASLDYVNVYGWSSDAISKGAETLGYSQMIEGMFPGGGRDLINFFYHQCNDNLELELKRITDPEKKKQGTTAFVKNAVESRLRMHIPYMENWSQAAAIHASPANCSQGMQNIGTLMDHIWYYAGDRSSDFNWYTKRMTLAVVYKSTELCMIQDNSEDYKDTWLFLERRLQDLRTVANCIREAESKTKDIGSVGKAAILTGLNIFGMNIKSR